MQLCLNEQQPYMFTATGDSGYQINIAANSELAGDDVAGMRPTELLPAALAGCSAMDLRFILTKQRQQLESIDIDIDTQRDLEAVPSLLTSIHLQFKLVGTIDPAKASRALVLSLEKYCTVYCHLAPSIKISYDLIVNGDKVKL